MPIERTKKLFATAADNVIIVSAFIGKNALDELLSAIPVEVGKTIYVRWRMQDLVSRATDPEIYDVAKKHNARLFYHPDLHAKAYIAGENALVGSANATSPGLGMTSKNNLELLVPAKATSLWIKSLLSELRNKARVVNPISPEQMENFDKHWSDQDIGTVGRWVPNANYSETVALIQHNLFNQLAVNDFLALELWPGAREEEIKAAARKTEVFDEIISRLESIRTEIDKSTMSEWLVSFSGNSKYRDTELCLPIFDWIDKCTNYYVLESGTENVKLTPWKKGS